MISKAVEEAIKGLLRKSRADQVNWYPANDLGIESVLVDDYAVSLPNHSINVYRSSESEAIFFAVLDDSGNAIYRVSAKPPDVLYGSLEELLSLAAFRARRIGDLLAHIKASLETDEVVGGKPQVIDEREIPF